MLPRGCRFQHWSRGDYRTFDNNIRLESVTLMDNSDIYGGDHNYLECRRVKSIIESCKGVKKDKIRYEVVDTKVIEMEYILWLMAMEMNEYIDDWKGPHSLLVTSYLFSII